MSKETEPIRSRRQLREQSAQTAGAPVAPAATAASVPVSHVPAAPADSGATAPGTEAAAPRERQSQTRARDRAALRAYKELIDPPGLSPLPSRKALRQAQLDAERAPITAVNPVVSVVTGPAAGGGSPQTQQSPVVGWAAGGAAAAASGQQDTAPAAEPAAGGAAASPLPQAAPAASAVPPLRTRAGRRAAPVAARSVPGFDRPAAQPPVEPRSEANVPEADLHETAAPDNGAAEAPATQATAQDAAGPDPVQPHDAQAAQAQPLAAAGPQPAPAAGKLPSPPATLPGSGALPTVAPAAVELDAPGVPETAEPAADAADGNFPPMPELVPGGAYYPVTAGPPVAPSTEELKVLAAKRAEAERAAVLAERAKARERLAQESAKNRRPAADPTATNNLAMVTPMEFMDVPGMDMPMLRPPATTHVPIVTRSTPRQAPAAPARPARPLGTGTPAGAPEAGTPETGAPDSGAPAPAARQGAPGPTVPNVSAERFDAALAARAVHRPGPGNRPLTGGRSSTLKRAEEMAAVAHPVPAGVPSHGLGASGRAAAEAVPVQRSQMPPMPADYAHGLEPLDAMTAGLGRTQRNLLIQWGSIILGGAAFVAGAIMVLTNVFN